MEQVEKILFDDLMSCTYCRFRLKGRAYDAAQFVIRGRSGEVIVLEYHGWTHRRALMTALYGTFQSKDMLLNDLTKQRFESVINK